MNCPKCEHKGSKVLSSSVISKGVMVRRRRQCYLCSMRWTTIEAESASAERVVKQAHRIIRAYKNLKNIMDDDST